MIATTLVQVVAAVHQRLPGSLWLLPLTRRQVDAAAEMIMVAITAMFIMSHALPRAFAIPSAG